ncbi:MAG: hypothetical protein JWM36_1850 [Hyphomicrobiales bacterium]|nr:hypothetical protein [Hyphomicrobiales bacterium]
MNALATIEPLVLPDARRPTAMPPLPAWAASRIASVNVVWLNGKQVSQLPEAMILSDRDREIVASHASHLSKLLDQTPLMSAKAEAETLTIIAKMMQALPGARATEDSAEAKGEAYMAALDDVATWAVREAVRKWYRAESGPKFNYSWAPGPGDLRTIAKVAEAHVRYRADALNKIAFAVPLVEFSEEHRAEMLKKLAALPIGLASPISKEKAA